MTGPVCLACGARAHEVAVLVTGARLPACDRHVWVLTVVLGEADVAGWVDADF